MPSQKRSRLVKREQRRIWKKYLLKFKDYLKPKPKYMPWWVWTWMQNKVLRMDKINIKNEKRR